MANEKEYVGRLRALRILRTLAEAPHTYTIKKLASIYEVNESTIKRDFEAFKNAGFNLDFNEQHRYALAVDKAYEDLRSMLVFTPKEEELMMQALQNMKGNEVIAEKLMRKLSRIYDVSKMHNLFDKNFLSKIDMLENALKRKKLAILKDYRSNNSNSIQDRYVEIFKVMPEMDIIHAFDLDRKEVRHFLISRIHKLEITQESWNFATQHIEQPADCFRIHDPEQVYVHMRVNVSGYNELIERFPMSRQLLKPVPDNLEQYEFEAKVNHQFYGLLNFIMGNSDAVVEIFEPYELIDRVKMEAQRLLEKQF